MLEARDLTLAGRLENVSVSLQPGAITAICGPNGAGKSTLLACLAGLLPPGGGAALLDGDTLDGMEARRRARAIGYLPQEGRIAWDVAVRSLVALGRLPYGRGGSGSDAVERALTEMSLETLADRPVSRLSGGEKARALLARVFAGEPGWILADEPLAALDLSHQLALLGSLRQRAQGGAGVVIVLHDLSLAMNHADRVVVLDRGRVVADGSPEQALGPQILRSVWGVDAHWLGEDGSRALTFAPHVQDA